MLVSQTKLPETETDLLSSPAFHSQNARNLGVHVNIADLQKKLLDLAERLEDSKGCLA